MVFHIAFRFCAVRRGLTYNLKAVFNTKCGVAGMGVKRQT
jgi:hypothetical protein